LKIKSVSLGGVSRFLGSHVNFDILLGEEGRFGYSKLDWFSYNLQTTHNYVLPKRAIRRRMADIVESVLGSKTDQATATVRQYFCALKLHLNGMIDGCAADDIPEEDKNYIMGDEVTARDEKLRLDTCKHCSEFYQFTWKSWETKVVVGNPKSKYYHAVSYVWGQTRDLPLICSKCNKTTYVPMESPEKFRRLMRLINKSGECLWLDALSIDQSDENQKQTLLSAMDDIYENAWSVIVLLPKSDERAYRLLSYLAHAASYLNNSQLAKSIPQLLQKDDRLTLICRVFNALIDEFEQNLHKWTYWRRAWTFQEWALAPNVTISLDKNFFSGNMIGVKYVILHAATLMAAYKLHQHQYSVIDFGYSRGLVTTKFNTIKRLFPDEQSFYPADMMEEEEARMGILLASFDFGKALGLRRVYPARFEREPPLQQIIHLKPDLKIDPDQKFIEQLLGAWHALGVSRREARFEADLVASWASMCNLAYDYKSDDSFSVALQKVLKVLRKRNLKIYCFNVNTTDMAVDTMFLDYASPHKQCNATNSAYFHGLPVLTGRTDTLIHFRSAAMQPAPLTILADQTAITFRKLPAARVESITGLQDFTTVMGQFSMTMSGPDIYADTMMATVFTDVRVDIIKFLESAATEDLKKKNFIVVNIYVQSSFEPETKKPMFLWTICPAYDEDTVQSYVVARESLNGVLVLAKFQAGGSALKPMAYLTMTDLICGTHLLRVEEDGKIDMTLRAPVRADILSSSLLDNRVVRAKVDLDTEEIKFGNVG